MDDGSKALQADPVAESQASLSGTRRAVARPVARRDVPRDSPAAVREVEIALDAGIFLRAALGCIAVIVALGLVAAYAFVSEADVPRLVIRALLLDAEANIPTFFAFSLLVFCGILLALIAARAFLARNEFRFHWALLGGLFLLVAFDEAASLHERLNEPVRVALDTSGALHFAWVIPLGGFVALLALVYLRFLRDLPAPFGKLFVLSGALYVAGAIGVEMLGSAYHQASGNRTFAYQLITIAEETLEMLGIVVFAYALMRFLARRDGRVCLDFKAG